MTALRVNRSLALINSEHEPGQDACTVFQVFSLTRNCSNIRRISVQNVPSSPVVLKVFFILPLPPQTQALSVPLQQI